MSKKINKAKREENKLTVTKLVAEFKSVAVKSAENYLELARIVQAAKKLDKAAYSTFKQQVLFMDTGTSTFRKLEVVGSKHDIFQKYKDKLPANWTTIYTLARIESEKLEVLFNSGDIHQNLLGKEAMALAGAESKPKAKSHGITSGTVTYLVPNGTDDRAIRIGLGKLSSRADIFEVKLLLEKLGKFGVEIESLKLLDEMLDEQEPLKMAA